MNTELLNQFLFANLLEKHARQLNGGATLPIDKNDLKEAYNYLISLRMDMLDIVENSAEIERPDNVIEFKPKF